jgi:hypothetical protein
MVSESIVGDKFEPCMVYVCSLEFVFIRTVLNASDPGLMVMTGEAILILVPVSTTFCVVTPPPEFVIMPV